MTGATQGIGKAIAIALAHSGARVVIHGKTQAEASQAAASMPSALADQFVPAWADLSQPGQPVLLAQRCLELLGTVDIAVLNASIQSRRALNEIDLAQFQVEMQVNFFSSIEILQRLLPPMSARGWGRVLTIGSIQQIRPSPTLAIYAASKSAQLNLSIGLARQVAGSGVTVNNLAPGLIDTSRNDDLKANAVLYAEALAKVPMGFAGQTQDCASAALFLCSDAARYITGIDLLVDGGAHLL